MSQPNTNPIRSLSPTGRLANECARLEGTNAKTDALVVIMLAMLEGSRLDSNINNFTFEEVICALRCVAYEFANKCADDGDQANASAYFRLGQKLAVAQQSAKGDTL